MADNSQVVIEFVADTTGFNQQVDQLKAKLQATGDAGKKSFDDLNKYTQILEAGAKKTGVEAKFLSDKFRELGVAIPAEVMKHYTGELTEVINKHVTLRTQLLNAKQAFYELTEQGKKGTEEWNKARATLQKVAMQVDDLNKTVQRMASSTKVMAGLIDAAKGVAAGFEVARGASILFGAENKKAEEAIKQLVAVMAVLQGLQEVQLLLKEESAAMQLILNGRDLAAVGIKKLQTAAESENIIVSKAAAAAQWALNAAMEANPIMIIVGALAAATAALIYFTRETGESAEEVKKFNEEMEALNNTLYKSTLQRLRAQGEITEQQKKELEINTEASKKSLAILKDTEEKKAKIREDYAPGARGDVLFKQNKEVQRLEEEQTAKLKSIEQDRQNQLAVVRQQGLEELANQEADARNKADKRAEEARKKAIEENKKYWEKLLKQSDEEYARLKKIVTDRWNEEIAATKAHNLAMQEIRANRQLEAQLGMDFNMTMLEIDEEFYKSDYETFAEYEKAKRKEMEETTSKELEELRKRTAEQEKQEQEKTRNIQLAIQKAIEITTRAADAIFQIEQQHRQADFDAAMQKLEQEKEEELANDELTKAQKAAINKRFQRLEAAEKLKAWKADQKAAETQAAIKMALAVINAWATSSSIIEAVIRSAAAVAIGGIEIGIIASQKPPAFAKGTEYLQRGNNPAGTDTIPIMANEGERIVPTHINKMLKGISNEDLPNLIPPIPHAPDAREVNVVVPTQEIDYKKLAEAFAKELKNNPQTVVNLDKSGFSLHIIENQRRVERLNNRYNG